MVVNFQETPSIASKIIAELRDVHVQTDSMRFRYNLERLGSIMAYEISKLLSYDVKEVETPLGIANCEVYTDRIVLATILRAGLPFHNGFLNMFDDAENGFVTASRILHKDGTFDIELQYMSCPDLTDAILIVSDPMLATGASMGLTLNELFTLGKPKETHVATAIASTYGLNHLKRLHKNVHIWMGALDDELTAKSYIVPGLGDAGDLAFGAKNIG